MSQLSAVLTSRIQVSYFGGNCACCPSVYLCASSETLTAALAKTFMYRAFDSEEYARSLSAQSDGDKDLIEKRAKISQVIALDL